MADIFWHFIIGFVVSFVGSIPLGTVNLAVIQTTVSTNFRAGFYLALGATFIELIYSAIAIKFIAILIHNPSVKLLIGFISIPVLILLGIFYFRKEDTVEVQRTKNTKSFFNGMFIGLINPLQIPFWVAYGSLLLSKNVITDEPFLLDVFIVGICLGSLLVLTLLALLSKRIISRLSLQTKIVNKVIGVILFAIAGYELIKLSYHFIQ